MLSKVTFSGFVSALILIASSLQAQAAFFRAELPTPNADPAMGAHVIIAGKGLEVGDQWLKAAHTQALLFKDRQRHGKIVLISAIDKSNYSTLLRDWGYQNVAAVDRSMTSGEVIKLLNKVPSIASLDFIGHNGAILGFAFESYSHRFFLDAVKSLAPLKTKFTKDSFIRVLGCNTGWRLAPALAETLGVPASGTFTYADIQNLHNLGDWFYHDEGRYPSGFWLDTNSRSFFKPIACTHIGGCVRLKTVSSSYTGTHGDYSGGLPFMKYFCGPLDRNDCFRRMAMSTQYLVGNSTLSARPTLEQFAETLADQFCPAWKDLQRKANCHAKVIDHVFGRAKLPRTFSTFVDRSLSCNFRKCSFEQVCTDKCVLIAKTDQPSTAYVDEIDAYLAGYQLWINSGR
jgi:hypothetical protein